MHACPQCQRPLALATDGGHLACEGCGATLWFAKLIDPYQAVTKERIEAAFGFKTEDFDEVELLELVRELAKREDELSHAWAVDDFQLTPRLAPIDGTNPYHPPAAPPRRADFSSESFSSRNRYREFFHRSQAGCAATSLSDRCWYRLPTGCADASALALPDGK